MPAAFASAEKTSPAEIVRQAKSFQSAIIALFCGRN
jgi:hypothetical protein